MFTKETLERIFNDNQGKEIALEFGVSVNLGLNGSENTEFRNWICKHSPSESRIIKEWKYKVLELDNSFIKIKVYYSEYHCVAQGYGYKEYTETYNRIVYYPLDLLVKVSVYDEIQINYDRD